MRFEPVDRSLAALAAACGVTTSYFDYRNRPVDTGAEPVRLALAAMGVAADDAAAVRDSLERLRSEAAGQLLAPSSVVRAGTAATVALPAGTGVVEAAVRTEDGTLRPLPGGEPDRVAVPADLPPGYHQLRIATGSAEASALLVVAPLHCPLPGGKRRSWGWMAQLYSACSRESWGMGDYGDLATLAAWSGGLGAAMLLVNPLHAAVPVLPQNDSPYYPSSRRYRSPLYLRLEALPEHDALPDTDRAEVARLAAQARSASGDGRIDRDAVFVAKTAGLELLATAPRSPGRVAAFAAWRQEQGQGVVDFATFCALAERHGTPWQHWPAALRHPREPAVVRAGTQLAARVEFHIWLQWLCDTQLAEAAAAAGGSGMAVGVVHDLAVGVDPGGADAWALQDDLAVAMTVGAPPDGFNQRGQDWRLPPLLPGRLAATGYAPFRDMLRSVLRSAGGVRVDHIMGLWRLWWVPEGRPASDGIYVRYPAEELLGVLALEAHRANALVIGEDLGTVEDGVRETLASRQILSSRVLYFEHVDDDADQPLLPAADYPPLAVTSITTHDLPTAAGWWADEDVRVQTELGLYGASTTPQAEADRKAGERAQMCALLVAEGLVDPHATDDELVAAMHAFLARTPSVLVATGLGDALGDRRQPNLPGTTDEYPNWRLPLARWRAGAPEPVDLEEVMADPRVLDVAAALNAR
ncbi:MAG: 4-alpha-glucanotransferase [Actinomycetota bacterium]|jgi:4-alpha-glucanotransferase|nr:4-alpha-glucanotransferase [Actinomycetota bacterium]